MDPNSGSSLPPPERIDPLPAGHDGRPHGASLDSSKPLPATYGDNRIVIMARDPLCIFAYWEATPERFEKLRQQVGDALWQKGQAVLRAYDVTAVDGDPARAERWLEVDIQYDAMRWYITVPEAGRAYVVELGFRFPDGRFLALLGSNRVTLPRGTVSTQTDSRWMIVNVEQWDKMFDSPDHQYSRGSAETSKMMAQRWEFLRSVFSGSSSGLSSGTLSRKEEPKR